MKHMKGITPVISIIILVLITVSLAGVAYVFLGGYLGTYTEKAFVIPPGGAFCVSQGTANVLNVTVKNLGTTSLTASTDDFIVALVNGVDNTTSLTGAVIPSGGTGVVLSVTGLPSDTYNVKIGTSSGVLEQLVVC